MRNEPTLDAYSVWDRIVYMFTCGSLTRESDKLVAISGLAAKMQTFIGGEYLAGMWRGHLAYQLLWQVRRVINDVPRTRPSE